MCFNLQIGHSKNAFFWSSENITLDPFTKLLCDFNTCIKDQFSSETSKHRNYLILQNSTFSFDMIFGKFIIKMQFYTAVILLSGLRIKNQTWPWTSSSWMFTHSWRPEKFHFLQQTFEGVFSSRRALIWQWKLLSNNFQCMNRTFRDL